MGTLRLDRIEKTFPGGVQALQAVDLSVGEGELVVLLGPSGCGKSTLLRIVAGVEAPTGGRVHIDGRDVTDLSPQDRDVAMVFQSYALYPHMNVRDNLGFGLRMRGWQTARVAERVAEVAAQLELTRLLDRRPSQLSGGQRQRVALGRAIARRPAVFLLDEPLSNLDAQLRVTARAELGRLHREIAAPILYVTHDQEEAMTLGDRVAVMTEGRVLQLGSSMEIYARPANRRVAAFVGSPRINLLEGTMGETGAGPVVELFQGRGRVQLGPGSAPGPAPPGPVPTSGPTPGPAAAPAPMNRSRNTSLPASSASRLVEVGIRPEDLRLVESEEVDFMARIDLVEPLGRETLLHVAPVPAVAGDEAIRVLAPPDRGLAAGTTVGIQVRPGSLHLFDPRTGDRLEIV